MKREFSEKESGKGKRQGPYPLAGGGGRVDLQSLEQGT